MNRRNFFKTLTASVPLSMFPSLAKANIETNPCSEINLPDELKDINRDFHFDPVTKDIRYVGHPNHKIKYTVKEFHGWLCDMYDNIMLSESEYDIFEDEFYDRVDDYQVSLINGTNIDSNTAEHLCEGTVTQDVKVRIHGKEFDSEIHFIRSETREIYSSVMTWERDALFKV